MARSRPSPDPRADPTLAGAVSAAALTRLAFVSGATGLVYQALWLRSFGLVFGNTTDAVAAVLATFMGGLALGSLAASRRPARDPLRAYALVEGGIGIAALLSLPLLRALPALSALSGATGATAFAIRMMGSAAIVLPATLLMGATIPLLVEERTRRHGSFHASFGRLYLVNTLGGAFGVLAAGFFLVPWLGTNVTLVAAAAANLVIGALAWRWASARPAEDAPAPVTAAPDVAAAAGGASLALTLAFLSGLASFALEVLWTRSYALIIGSSVYAFNTMLLAILLGLVLGTAAWERARARTMRPASVAGATLAAIAAMVLASSAAIGWLPVAMLALMKALPVSFAAHQAAAFALCFFTMLPVTFAFGFSFPLLGQMMAGSPQASSGRLYAASTAGAIGGAVLADLVLVARFGLQRSFAVVAAVALVAGLWALLRERPPAVRWTAAAAVVVLTVVGAPRWQPWSPLVAASGVYKYGLEWKDTFPSALDLPARLAADRTLLFYEEGREAVVAVTESRLSRRRFLSINGKTDAGSGAQDVLTQKYLAHLPLLLHPRPRTALVIGWGAGATAASAALHPLESLECVEIEPATYRAAPLFGDLSGRVRHDPRFRIAFRDGRTHLLATRSRYDVIVSEPSNPWISGVSNLFTREFYEIVRGRLAERGVFGQWFHYYNLRPEDVMVEVRTFLAVFPEASLWLVPPVPDARGTPQLAADLLLVGSVAPHGLDHPRLQEALSGAIGADLRATGALATEAALLATFAMGRADLAAWAGEGPPLNTDAFPYLEFQAPRGNVQPPHEVARQAVALFEGLGGASAELLPPLLDYAPLAAGGAVLAAAYEEQAAERSRLSQPLRTARLLRAAVTANPRAAAAHAQLGQMFAARNHAKDAEPHLVAAAALDPTQHGALDALAVLYLERRDMSKAESAHRDLVRHHPWFVPGHLRLGAILARRGAWRESRAALAEALRLDPHAPVDRNLIEYLDRQIAALPGR